MVCRFRTLPCRQSRKVVVCGVINLPIDAADGKAI